jgi:hypothetical protein
MREVMPFLMPFFFVPLAVAAACSLARAADATAIAFPELGRIAPRSAQQIASSNWSIGGETLDRDYAVYAHYKKYLGPLGAKSIRLQAGWAKTERHKGVYDWPWLDEIIADALAQGVQPWLETSYGNPLYEGGGGTGLGDGIPKSAEALAAWDSWVLALVRRYKDRVKEWEVWNEPDLGKQVPAEAYAEFFIRTAKIIRGEQPGARVYALALAGNMAYAETFLKYVQQKEQTGLMDAVTIHGYPKNPDDTGNVDRMRKLLHTYAPSVQVRQGETGAPSTSATSGALSGHPWTELTQAKWDLRRMLAHLGKDVPFNLFTLMEFEYSSARLKGLNTKGLLKANEDKTVARPKPSYFAAQHVMSVFDDRLSRLPDYPCTTNAAEKLAVHAYARAQTKQQVVAAWFCGGVPWDSNATTPVDFRFKQGDFQEPVYADLRTGVVYRIPKENWSREGDEFVVRGIPVYDSPILIAEKSALTIEEKASP